MYGPRAGEWIIFMLVIALIGGLACVGLEHCGAWAMHHVTVGLK